MNINQVRDAIRGLGGPGSGRYPKGSGDGDAKPKGINRRSIMQSNGKDHETRLDHLGEAHMHEMNRFNVEGHNIGAMTTNDSIGSKPSPAT
jgi:hypothetical protein